jgi:hypothetical protein
MRRLIAVAVALSAVACGDGGNPPPPYSPPGNVLSVDIDTDAQLQAEGGKGAGLFVEYATGGKWHVFAACDTTQSGFDCTWDLVVSLPDAKQALTVSDKTDLDASDAVLRVDEGALRLFFRTSTEVDGVRLSAPAGQQLQVDVILDGVHDGSFVNWVGGGAAKAGAPSDPIIFLPTAP